ncbi:hypothetical protein GCM10010319_67310 [Streptomyces blastmyceticus]|uniref:Uncharacterized protein n=2 Tax=Streptomyces blastmyceticus TaxID=68180 RepID=A0ABN0Y277_9ACTN
MLDCHVTAVNNDTSTISGNTGIEFPKHLTDEVGEYLVTGGGFFDFKGRDGLLKTIAKFVPKSHYLYQVIKDSKHKDPLNLLVALRNFSAHEPSAGPGCAPTTIREISAAEASGSGGGL